MQVATQKFRVTGSVCMATETNNDNFYSVKGNYRGGGGDRCQMPTVKKLDVIIMRCFYVKRSTHVRITGKKGNKCLAIILFGFNPPFPFCYHSTLP